MVIHGQLMLRPYTTSRGVRAIQPCVASILKTGQGEDLHRASSDAQCARNWSGMAENRVTIKIEI